MTKQRVVMCQTDEFCMHQYEEGGAYENGEFTPLKVSCIATPCPYPSKQCLYRKIEQDKQRRS